MTLAYHPALTSPIRVVDYIRVARPRRVLVAEIMRATCEYYGTPPEDLVGRCHARLYAHPRQLAMYLSRKLTRRSLPEIGRAFGRDHSTVVHAIRVVTSRLEIDPELRADHDAIVEALSA